MLEGQSNDESGLIGISVAGEQVSNAVFFGLMNLQHRGQQSACIVANHNGVLNAYWNEGLVSDVFNSKILEDLQGNMCLGYVKKNSDKKDKLEIKRPFTTRYKNGDMHVALNGDIHSNTNSDSKFFAKLVAQNYKTNMMESLKETMKQIQGGYAVVILTTEHLIGLRDAHGIRPLCLGKLDDGYVLASESCAFDIIGAEFIRDIEPGEIVIIKGGIITSEKTCINEKKSICVFEYVYTARPDSVIDERGVYKARENAGKILAREHYVEGDIVIAVPGSGTPAAVGFSVESGIPFAVGLVENRYIGRTFINPFQDVRELEVKIKLNPIKEIVKDKKVILVDDSIVRGTTSQKIIYSLRNAGAKEVHMRISSPQVTGRCYFGMDTLDEKSLIANTHTLEEIRERMGADTLGFISLEGLYESLGSECGGYCMGCFTREYPIMLGRDLDE